MTEKPEGWGENTVNIIAARPSIGKTFMALKAALSAFKEVKSVQSVFRRK
ncbi:hypothetical protein [Vibrio phage J14]|nr:hypothetical protein [Vibrio phage J14]